MLNEDSKKILVTMSEMIFYQERDINELKIKNEGLKKQISRKK